MANTEDSQMVEASLTSAESQTQIDSDSDDDILSSFCVPIFPELAEKSREQESLTTQSQYALVVFHGVAESYPTDSDIGCHYTLTNGIEAAPGDRVVLFTVGWTSIKDYVVFEWTPVPERDERDLTVVFKAADLPKDVNEFYQFCYVSSENIVCGASVPFQVHTPDNDELTFALEEDMVFVRSSTAVAQDKLFKAQLDRRNLMKEKLNLEKELRSLEDKHSLTLRRLDRLQETLSTSNSLNEELQKENVRLSSMAKETEIVKKELEEAQTSLAENIKKQRTMQEHMAIMSSAVKKRKLDICHITQLNENLFEARKEIDALREARRKVEEEMVTATENLSKTEENRASLSKKIFELENELTVCKFNLNNAQVESLRLKAELEDITKDNANLKQELEKTKESEGTLKRCYAEYFTDGNDIGRLIMENSRLQRSTEDMQLRISTLEHEKLTVEQVLEDTLNAEKNSCSNHCSLEKQVAQLRFSLDEAKNKEEASKSNGSCPTVDELSPLMLKEAHLLVKLLEDSLAETQLRLQENTALRSQNEDLELRLSCDQSKTDESVIASTSQNRNSRNQSQEMGTNTINSQGITYDSNAEIEEQKHQLEGAESGQDLSAKRVEELEKKIGEMETEYGSVVGGLNTEIANLVSKNETLVAQEIQSRKYNNKMRWLLLVNDKLLTENDLLKKKIHEREEKATADAHKINQAIQFENEQMRRYLTSDDQSFKGFLETTRAMGAKMQRMEQEHKSLQKELELQKKLNADLKTRYLQCTVKNITLMRRLTSLQSQVDNQSSHECCAEPKLEQIKQGLEHLVSAMEKLSSSKDDQAVVSEVEDLKHRLHLARIEYEKVHTVMINYRTKYIDLKRKFQQKMFDINHPFFT